MNSGKIRTRFAPSPTGSLHIGGLRTCVYAYALAKHHGGDFVLRIEDTDQKREVPEATAKLKEALKIFGIGWDEYYVQSERVKTGIYKKAAEKLIEGGYAFYCQCAAKNAKKEGFSSELRDPCRDKGLTTGAIKLKVPDGEKIGYKDFVLDKYIEWETSSVSDTTLLKSDGFPTYHLAVIVDDTDMNITHALRGHDWMPSTPIHLLTYKFMGYKMPELGHLTDIQDPDGGKLSKRKGSVACESMIAEGYLPEAILNFVILLGWAPKDNRELFTLPEFVKAFDHKGFQKSNPVFNREKLDWFNGVYVRQLPDDELFSRLQPFLDKKWDEERVKKMIPLAKDRVSKLTDFSSLSGFVFEEKDPLCITDNCQKHISSAFDSLESVDKWEKENIDTALMGVVKDNDFKTGDFFMDLRGVLSGSKVTPPINDSIVIIGKEEVLARLKKSLKK